MNIKRGLHQLQACLKQHAPDRLADFLALEARLEKTENNAMILGDSPTLNSDYAQITRALNHLALTYCDVSFNELCETPASESESDSPGKKVKGGSFSAPAPGQQPSRKLRLFEILDKRFSEGELRQLCSLYLKDVKYDDLPGNGKPEKILELLDYLERRDRLDDLVAAGKTFRPKIDWPRA